MIERDGELWYNSCKVRERLVNGTWLVIADLSVFGKHA